MGAWECRHQLWVTWGIITKKTDGTLHLLFHKSPHLWHLLQTTVGSTLHSCPIFIIHSPHEKTLLMCLDRASNGSLVPRPPPSAPLCLQLIMMLLLLLTWALWSWEQVIYTTASRKFRTWLFQTMNRSLMLLKIYYFKHIQICHRLFIFKSWNAFSLEIKKCVGMLFTVGLVCSKLW